MSFDAAIPSSTLPQLQGSVSFLGMTVVNWWNSWSPAWPHSLQRKGFPILSSVLSWFMSISYKRLSDLSLTLPNDFDPLACTGQNVGSKSTLRRHCAHWSLHSSFWMTGP